MAGSRGSRMAGEELTKAQRHEQMREQIANDPERAAERLSSVDRDKYDFSGYSDKDIIMAYQGGTFDENDYTRLTGGKPVQDKPEQDKPVTTQPVNETKPTTPTTTPLYGSGGASVTQDNDVSITGDGNQVNQDNSVNQNIDNSRYYGGSNRYFNYNGGKGDKGLYDTPVSMATVGGYYDVDDSPAAGQAFLDRYITGNNDAQRESDAYYKSTGTFDYRKLADSSRAFNPEAMQERLDREPLIDRERSKLKFGKLFGDMDNFNVGTFEMPSAPRPITSNVKGIADDYRSKM